jgi:hypothetical protein
MSDSRAIGWYGPKHKYWDWMLGHFCDVVLLNDRNVENWFHERSEWNFKSAVETNASSVLLVAIESRFDPSLELIARLEQQSAPNDPKEGCLPWAVVLGEAWVGHRRTNPLPETLQSFYWYELYDRLIPWIIGLSHSADVVASTTEVSGNANKRRVSPRVLRVIDTSVSIGSRLKNQAAISNPIRLAIVVSETATTRQLWYDALTSHGIQCLATTPENVDLWTKPDVIIVDLETEPLAMQEAQVSSEIESRRVTLARKLSTQFPDATLLVADAFPRWETWSDLRQAGADILVAKPYQMTGILDTLAHCG